MRKLKSRTTGYVAAMALLGVVLSTPLLAQDTPPPPPSQDQTQGPPPRGEGQRGMNPERRVEMLQRQLNLTPDQTTQVKAIFAEGQAKMEALRGNTTAAPEDRRSQMMALRQSENEKIRGVLTPDQKTKFDAMQARRRQDMQNRGPGGDNQGPPPPPPPPPGQPQP